ncbi:hypothetical protein VSR01_16685 [Actinacidiphila sp. DG2A-62]|uniref:hypothetical protein n=1 Tax=Actinacidiphila sp. DG2A-62 TaxID=3108821 RepID=UPI002DBD58CE|nr:hypothetical protein [Actinacidiphila sp. DG2A-62]MEC3995083.1 hypothetical protein [Actinacidiphila sp. DG2A-62]
MAGPELGTVAEGIEPDDATRRHWLSPTSTPCPWTGASCRKTVPSRRQPPESELGRGATHRFNRDPSFPARNVALYGAAAELLRGMGVPVLVIDAGGASPAAASEQITSAALAGVGNSHYRGPSNPSQRATPA